VKRIVVFGLFVAGAFLALGASAGVVGVSIQDLTQELADALGIPTEGVIVRQVSPGGPAEAAGVRVGDVIVEVNRKAVKDKDAFVAAVKKTPAGKSVALTIWREGEGRYFLGVRVAEEGSIASPQEDRLPRPRGEGPAEPSEPRGPEPTPDAGTKRGSEGSEAPRAAQSLVRDGGFEDGFKSPWGTGDISEGRTWRLIEGARAYAEVELSTVHTGRASLRIRHASEEHEGWMGITSQSLGSLEAGRDFTLEVWASAKDLHAGGVRVRVVRHGTRPGVAKGLTGSADQGEPELPVAEIALPGGSYDWRRLEARFRAPSERLDLEILSVDEGTAYLDDIAIVPGP
jgi:PDZ domain-containing protein